MNFEYLVFLISPKISHFKILIFLHDKERQRGASFEYDAVSGQNLHVGIKGDEMTKSVFYHLLLKLVVQSLICFAW